MHMHFNNPSMMGTWKTNKDPFVSIRKIYERRGSTTCLSLPEFQAVTGCYAVSYFFNVPKRLMFERASSGITPIRILTYIYLTGNVKRKLELLSLCGMTVISCLSQ